VHGLFASISLRETMLRALARRRGVTFVPRGLPSDPYADLAGWFRASVDIAKLLQAVGLGPRG